MAAFARNEPAPSMDEAATWASEKLMRAIEGAPVALHVGALVREAAGRHPERPALVFFDDGETLTYRDLVVRSNKLAHGLGGIGVGRGTRVAVMVRTSTRYPTTWLALASLGAVTVPINDSYTSRELLYILEDSQAEFLVIEYELLAVFEDMERAPLPRAHVIVVGGDAPGYGPRWEALADGGDPGFVAARTPEPDDLMNIQYTSGTTGLPKGAMHSQRFWLAFGKVGAAQFQNQIRRLLIAQPFYYLDGQWLFLMAVHQGATAFVARRQSASRFLGWVKDFRINYCNFPEVVSKQPERPDDADNELVVLSCYSHRKENYPSYERRYGCLARQGFSMTEVGCGLYVPMEAWAMTGTGTVGIPVAFREAMVAGDDGRPVPRGDPGELCLRGPTIFEGYYNQPEATARAFHAGGWFRTGDLARQDETGWFYYLGRLKDTVRRSSENISAVEVEAVLRAISEVMEAAVVPVPDEARGEEVKAYLLLRPGLTPAELPPERVFEHCRRNLAPFKIPRYLEYVAEFPRTPSFKIKKSALLAQKPDLRAGAFDRVAGAWR